MFHGFFLFVYRVEETHVTLNIQVFFFFITTIYLEAYWSGKDLETRPPFKLIFSNTSQISKVSKRKIKEKKLTRKPGHGGDLFFDP